MLRFKQFLIESKNDISQGAESVDPYNWDKNYGKRFKFVRTPKGTQVPPTSNETISLVTPANGDAWNWEEITGDQLDYFRKNWSKIQKTIGAHKRIQIETGQIGPVEV